ncbi:MAG: hypothetical protein JWM18_1951 [Chloroflexi bacterium]|nr:hypothetical protein [Chloroflexota bacterium]
MAQPSWHCHPGVLVAARGVAAGPVPAIVVGPASAGRRPAVVLAVRRPGGDEWTPFVVQPHQVLTTWEQWRGLIREALDQQATVSRRPAARPVARTAASAAA